MPPAGLVQLNDVYGIANLAPDAADRVEVRVTGGAGRVAAWATPVDDSTNDGAFVAAHPAASALLIPAVARSAGQFGARFVSDLKISNAGPAPARVQVGFSPFAGPGLAPVTVTLAANETRAYADVLGTLLAATDDTAGALRISALDGASVYASTRTSTTEGGRSYGLAVDPAVPLSQAAAGRSLALAFLASTTTLRTNVGFVETSGISTLLRTSLFAPDGTKVATRDLRLDPFAAVQWNDVFAEMQTAPLPAASLVVDVLSGGGATAYAVVVDNRTNDASYFPASLLPAPAP